MVGTVSLVDQVGSKTIDGNGEEGQGKGPLMIDDRWIENFRCVFNDEEGGSSDEDAGSYQGS